MIDKLELRIPFLVTACLGGDVSQSASDTLFISLEKYKKNSDIPLMSGSIDYDLNGNLKADKLRHPWESIPSSWSGLAFKIFDSGRGEYEIPHVIIHASPAKLFHCHNVYGTDNFEISFQELMTTFAQAYPEIYADLDIAKTELRRIDVTYSARMKSNYLAEQAIKICSSVSKGHVKPATEQHATTVYWNKKSTYYRLASYIKWYEVNNELNEIESKIKRSNGENQLHLERKKAIMSSALQYSIGLLRFEARIMARQLEKRCIPTNIFELEKYIRQFNESNEKTFMRTLWDTCWKNIFESFEGLTMDNTEDDNIVSKIELKFMKYDKAGRPNKRRINTLKTFYFSIKNMGYKKTKEMTSRTTMHMNMKDLESIGLSRSFLQNMEPEKSNVVPLVREITINFGEQHPADWVEPTLTVHKKRAFLKAI